MYIGNLEKLEDKFIQTFKYFFQFPEFLKLQQIFPVKYEPLKSEIDQYRHFTVINNFFGCPCTTGKEIGLMLN